MFAVVEKTINRVLYFLGDAVITDGGLRSFGEVIALDVLPQTHAVVEAVPPPGLWIGGVWALTSGVWTVADQGRYAAAVAEAKKRALEIHAEAVQRHLDATVQARDYADIATCVTYADEPAVPRYQAEGQAARAWRSLVWAAVHEVWRSVEAGERDAPSVEALIAELPVIVWP